MRVSQSVQPLFWERMLKSQARCQRELSLPMTTMSRRWVDQDVRAGLEMEMPPMLSQFFSQVESENWGVLVKIDCMVRLKANAYRLVEDLTLRCSNAKDVNPVRSLARSLHQQLNHPSSRSKQPPHTHPRSNSHRTLKRRPLKLAPITIPTIPIPSLAKQCACLFIDAKGFEVILSPRDQRRRETRE